MLNTFFRSICAGILISVGGSVFLACDNRYVGAVLFSVALLCICIKGYALYTGRIGTVVSHHTKKDILALPVILAGNVLLTFICGVIIRFAIPAQGQTAEALCYAKLTQTGVQTFIRAVFCGILMYLAVSIYQEKKTTLGILFCVPVFILSGFEHSIADTFYFGASGIYSGGTALFLIIVIIGNSVGGVLLPLLQRTGEKKNEP